MQQKTNRQLDKLISKLANNNKINIMPAYSMGKASKQPTFIDKSSTPGVGAYQTIMWNRSSRIKTSPSTSMPKTKKFFNPMEKQGIQVGPGSYNPEKPYSKIMVSIKGKMVTNFNTEVPSPANYNAEKKFPTKQYSFGRSLRKFKTEEGPGPGSYTVNILQSTSTKFCTQSREKLLTQVLPGPGTYHYQSTKTISSESQQFSFPKQKKFIIEEAEQKQKRKIPGPGAYSTIDFKKKFRGGKFTQGQRVSIAEKVEVPGPGAYNPKNPKQKSQPKAIIGSEKRQMFKTQATPGPGSYQVPKSQVFLKKQGVAIFAQANRLKVDDIQTPGPGSYDSKKLFQSRAFSITSRHNYKSTDKTPGPQDYNPQYKSLKVKSGNAIFGSEDRLRKLKKQIPGPGQYQLDMKNYSKTFYFTKAKKIQKNNSTVGPGQYKLKPFIGMYDGVQRDAKDMLYV